MVAYPETYYAATAIDDEERAELAGDREVDVCIVGGGLAGLSAALELAERGKRVAVLEAARVGWGASGRNGGFVGAGYSQDTGALERKLGADHARRLYALSREGVDIVENNVERFTMRGVAMTHGRLHVVRHDSGDDFAAHVRHMAETYGDEAEFLSAGEVRKRLKTKRYFQGESDASGFHMHPLNYVLQLASACEAAGVEVFENTRATAIGSQDGRQVVTCAGGSVRADDVVLCTSAYGRGLSKRVDRAVLPVATYVVASTPCADALDGAIATTAAISDTRRAGDYYRRLADGRLLWGGRITTQRAEPRDLAPMLKRDIQSIYPQLTSLESEYAWVGLMGYAVHKMPIVRRLSRGLWVSTAFGGHGLNTTAIAGRVIAEAIAGETHRIELFGPFGARWGGGPIGRMGTQAAYWWYQLRDRIDEKS